ncbi:hypothetical protein A8990_14212 [Paenibacillus taihuensis]|uniref:Uncharacterized protein n=1 Tax=Paenibacillus taihuensis TaxID=1156355 RepID=A0A3D9QUK9_9BACL|nr:hypothetical protein [Paenibacillus taihuensis]REE67585.1 hypothetical protein A8990_14212 [Paenibacillus taihuensis]
MNATLIVVGVSVFLVLVILIARTSRYRTVLTAPGSQAEELQNKHAYLHGRGIRSRIREEGAQPTAGIAAGTMHTSPNYSAVQLQVHKEDVEQAKQALEDYTLELHTSHSPLL